MNSEMTTVPSVTARDTPRACRKPGSRNTEAKLSKDPPNGRKVGFVDWRVTLDNIDELTIQ